MLVDWLVNPEVDRSRIEMATDTTADPVEFHRRLDGYAPTRLVELADVAASVGLQSLHAKADTDRFGLPSFKPLGAFWAAHRMLCDWAGLPPTVAPDQVRRVAGSATLVTATDGNHGRAVARAARLVGAHARVHVPAEVDPTKREAILAEGAVVIDVPGTYDDAVASAGADAASGPGHLEVADTTSGGHSPAPGWCVDGYQTLFTELADQFDLGAVRPDVTLVPVGVGSLATAAIRANRDGRLGRLVAVEPAGSACLLASVRSGRVVRGTADHSTAMAGLVAGEVNRAVWPDLRLGIASCAAIDDASLVAARDALGAAGVQAGDSGCATLAALFDVRAAGVPIVQAGERVLVLVTEGR